MSKPDSIPGTPAISKEEVQKIYAQLLLTLPNTQRLKTPEWLVQVSILFYPFTYKPVYALLSTSERGKLEYELRRIEKKHGPLEKYLPEALLSAEGNE